MKAVDLGKAFGLLAIGCVLGCSHSRAVEKTEGGSSGVTTDARGNPELVPNPENPLIVDAPEKFLVAGGGRRIQDALRKKGVLAQPDQEELGEPTAQALARFQRSADLAATGFPDAETLKALDLDPDEIYRPPLDDAQMEQLFRKQRSEARRAAADRSAEGEEAGETAPEEE